MIGQWPKPLTPFCCRVCKLPGMGAYNARVHDGACKKEQHRRTNARLKAKAKALEAAR